MILYPTEMSDLFNTMIVELLDVIFNDYILLEDGRKNWDVLEKFCPKYLFREQYKKCCTSFEDLYEWSADDFYHELDTFHEMILYYFLEFVSDYFKGMGYEKRDFEDIFFTTDLIEKMNTFRKRASEDGEKFSLREIKNILYDIKGYADYIFEDTDFLMVEMIYNNHKYSNGFINNYLGIDVDKFKPLLPLDIQEKIGDYHITLFGEIHEFLTHVSSLMHNGFLYKLFWENGKAINENKIQIIIDNLLETYFYKRGIEIIRESRVGSGEIDFTIYNKQEEKVLIEIKKANNPLLKKGCEEQLVKYMLSSRTEKAFYLIACFTEKELKKTCEFINNYVYTKRDKLYINLSILDCRLRLTASK